MEVAAPVQAFVPATSLGLLARRTHHDARGTWALGWFTVGTAARRRRPEPRARARRRADDVAAPRPRGPSGRHDPRARALGIAGAYTFAGASSVHYQSRPESFLRPVAVDTGTVDANSAFVLGLEVAARRGPLSLQGEYLHAFVDRASVTFPGSISPRPIS
jgi:hypothetical protein